MLRAPKVVVGFATCLLLAATAQPARADTKQQQIDALLTSIETTRLYLQVVILDSFYENLADAQAAYEAGDLAAFTSAVTRMQADIGDYSNAVQTTLNSDCEALLVLDPTQLEFVLDFIEDRMDEIDEMIEAVEGLDSVVNPLMQVRNILAARGGQFEREHKIEADINSPPVPVMPVQW